MADKRPSIDDRVSRAAEAVLAELQYVTPIDVLIGVGWLTSSAVDRWRQGRVDDLEPLIQVNLDKISTAMAAFRRWGEGRGLLASEAAYIARTRDRRALRFTSTGGPALEASFRTRYTSPELSEAKRRRLSEKENAPPDLVVIAARKEWTCTACSGTGDLLIMEGPGPLCLGCADLDHLVFLAAGDPALTRRAKKGSGLAAVVVRFSASRRRYERRGILVEEGALAVAERECLADEEARRQRRLREEQAREKRDVEFQAAFAREVARLFPGCPEERAEAIAHHAAARHSGRVGRSAAGRALDPQAVTLAVVASVRHVDTAYDRLLMSGMERGRARQEVTEAVTAVLDSWRADDPEPTA